MCSVFLAAASCARSRDERAAGAAGAPAAAPAVGARPVITEAEYVSADGRRFVRLTDDFASRMRMDHGEGDYSDQREEVQAAISRWRAIGLRHRAPAEMSEHDLAQALQAVAIVENRLYLAAEPDYGSAHEARAQVARAGSLKVADGFNPSGGFETFFAKQPKCPGDNVPPTGSCAQCCGTDDRWAVAANTNWPYSTIIATFLPVNTANANWGANIKDYGCTWQLIGRSTAVAAAHCFEVPSPGPEIWYKPMRWGAAPDASDNLTNPIPAGYPTQYWEYSAQVPPGWLAANDPEKWDMGVIDFTGYATPNPGNTAGWVGWGVLSASDARNMDYQFWSVPKCNFNCRRYTQWPRIWGTTATRYPTAVNSSAGTVDFPGDCSAGSSGAGLYQFVPAWNGWYVTGTNSRFNSTGTACRARRFDADYLAFIRANSAEY